MTPTAFVSRLGRTAAWLIDTLIIQVLLARPIHPPVNRGGPGGRLPNDPGNYDAPSYPAERRQRAEEHMRLRRRQPSLRDIWREPKDAGADSDSHA